MSEERKDGGRAFPMSTVDGYSQDGMTLRDWFAGQALAGLLSGPQFGDSRGNFTALPREAYDIADAMLAERAKAEG